MLQRVVGQLSAVQGYIIGIEGAWVPDLFHKDSPFFQGKHVWKKTCPGEPASLFGMCRVGRWFASNSCTWLVSTIVCTSFPSTQICDIPPLITHRIHVIMVYLATFTMKINQIWVNIPCMDPMGNQEPNRSFATNYDHFAGDRLQIQSRYSNCDDFFLWWLLRVLVVIFLRILSVVSFFLFLTLPGEMSQFD